MSYYLTDSGFWIALLNEKDKYHQNALIISDYLFDNHHQVFLPWPILYEVVNTKLIRKNLFVPLTEIFENLKKSNKIIFLDDTNYREASLDNMKQKHPVFSKLSLVDVVLNQIILDEKIRLEGIITFNTSDFEFACKKRKIYIIDEYFNLS